MLKHATLWASTACFLTIGSGLAAQDANTVVATVGETEITLGQMIIARAKLPQQYNQFPPDVLFNGVLDQLIQQQLFADSLENEPARVKMAIENERRALLAGEAINNLTNELVTDEAVQAAYDARFSDFAATKEYNASHLLVDTVEEAEAAKARIDGGEDFAAVAQELSTGPSGPNGGNLGWFGPGAMVPEFEASVVDLEVGAVSEPVQTQFGWHVITLNEVRDTEKPALESVEQELRGQIQETEITAVLETLREEATVVMPDEGAFDPALIDSLDLLEPAAE